MFEGLKKFELKISIFKRGKLENRTTVCWGRDLQHVKNEFSTRNPDAVIDSIKEVEEAE